MFFFFKCHIGVICMVGQDIFNRFSDLKRFFVVFIICKESKKVVNITKALAYVCVVVLVVGCSFDLCHFEME